MLIKNIPNNRLLLAAFSFLLALSISLAAFSFNEDSSANAAPTAPPDSTTPTTTFSGAVKISSAANQNMLFSIEGGSLNDMARPHLWSDVNVADETFTLVRNGDAYFIQNVKSSKVLTIYGGVIANNAPIVQYRKENVGQALWYVFESTSAPGSYYLASSLNSAYGIALESTAAKHGTKLKLTTLNSTADKRFIISPILPALSDGIYNITGVASNKRLDVVGGVSARGVNVDIYQAVDHNSQRFKLSYNANTGYYTIVNLCGDKALDVTGATGGDLAQIVTWDIHGGISQMWRLAPDAKNGGYAMVNATAGKVISVYGALTSNGANAVTWPRQSTANQAWTFTPLVPPSSVSITGGNSSYPFDLMSPTANRFSMSATIIPRNAAIQALYWSSSNTAIATVDVNGNVQLAGSSGAVTITATSQINPAAQGSKSFTVTLDATNTPSTTLQGATKIFSEINPSLLFSTEGASANDHARPLLWLDSNVADQTYTLIKNGEAYFIQNVKSGKVLTIQGGKAVNNAPIVQYRKESVGQALWYLYEAAANPGSYYLVSALDRSFGIALESSSAATGTKLKLAHISNTAEMRFIVSPILPAVANDTYNVTGVASSKRLDVAGGSNSRGVKVDIYQTVNHNSQKFAFVYNAATGYYTIINLCGQKVLDVTGASGGDLAQIVTWDAHGGVSQMWRLIPDTKNSGYALINAITGKAASVYGASISNGANVVTWPSQFTANQAWTLSQAVLIEPGFYTISTAIANTVNARLDIAGVGTAVGTNLDIYSANESQAQRFSINHVSNGFYKLEAINSNLVVAVNDTNVELGAYTGADNQLWRITMPQLGHYSIVNKQSSLAMSAAGNSAAVGTNVQVATASDATGQIWKITPIPVLGPAVYKMASALNSSNSISTSSGSMASFANIVSNTSGQTVYLKYLGNNIYDIIFTNSCKSIDILNWAINTNGGGSVVQYDSHNGTSQQWRAEYVGNGKFRIRSVMHPGSALQTASAANDALVSLAGAASVESQYFTFSYVAAADPYTFSGTILNGIDVSSHQPANIGEIVSYDFLIVKATEGTTYVNPYHITQAQSALNRYKGLAFYHFASGGDAQAEATHFYNTIVTYKGQAAFFLDYEAAALNLGAGWVQAFITKFKELMGVSCGLYTSASVINSQNLKVLTEANEVALWSANYWLGYEAVQGYRHDIHQDVMSILHQYTSSGYLPGWSKALDLDLFRGTMADFKRMYYY